MFELIENTSKLLAFTENGYTFCLLPDGRYRCQVTDSSRYSFWRVRYNWVEYSHQGGESSQWYAWNFAASEKMILEWVIEAIVLGDGHG